MIATLMALAAAAETPPALRPGLEPMEFLVGHCWRGTFENGAVDTHCFEPVYGGQHVRDRHEVKGGKGTYAGETFYSAEPGGGVAFVYFNSLGGVSRGTMRAGEGALNFGKEQYRGADGREIEMEVSWRPVGEEAYEVVTDSADAPAMNGKVRYERVADAIGISEFRGPDGSHNLVHDVTIDAPAPDIWNAVATAEGWRSWAVPVAWGDDPDIIETSYAPGARRGDPSTIRQLILARIPGRMIAFRTVKAPQGFPDFDSFSRTTGVIELEPLGAARTRVRITGAGYPDTETGRKLLGFFREGNRISLERLRQRFVEGPVDWSKVVPAAAKEEAR